MWDGEEFKEMRRVEVGAGVVQVALARDGKTVAVVRTVAGDVATTDPPKHQTGLELFVFDVTDPPKSPKPLWAADKMLPGRFTGPASLAFSPSGKTLLATFGDPYPPADRGLDGTDPKGKSMGVRVWELAPKK